MNYIRLFLWASIVWAAYYLLENLTFQAVKECILFQIAFMLIMLFRLGLAETREESLVASLLLFIIGGIIFVLSRFLGDHQSSNYIR